ncbi:hypothetical protein FS837_004386 [Tulasnella sp. UAMH 9824]|nr:hypothetical protein FS837_004386 [Tulasnella sp. UAMH 9824]
MKRECPTIDVKACESLLHRLPPEILVEILRQYLQLGTRLRDLGQLSLVCKRWRVIVESAAVLWSGIDGAEGPSIVHKALHAAKDTPLDLTFYEHKSRMGRRAFFEAIGERIAHWRSLTAVLRSAHWDFALDALENGIAPNLETLHLSAQYGAEKKRNMVTLFGGNPAPSKLKEISLVHIPINLARLQLSGLKSISLWRTPSVSSIEIMNAIRGSPMIESIRLEHLHSLSLGAASQRGSDGDAAGNPPIHLGSLLRLLLEAVPVPFLYLLLSSISAPRLQTFTVRRELEARSTAEEFIASLRHQIPTLSRLTTDAHAIRICIASPGHYHIVVGGLDIALDMDGLPSTHSRETLYWICDHLGRDLRNLPLHLDVENWTAEDLSPLEWFNCRLYATKLKLFANPCYRAELERVILTVSRPTSTPMTWLFPQVKVIEITVLGENGGGDTIVEMIKNRHSAGFGQHGVVKPKPFREIRLAHGGKSPRGAPPPPIMEFLNKIRNVAKGADVYWENVKL